MSPAQAPLGDIVDKMRELGFIRRIADLNNELDVSGIPIRLEVVATRAADDFRTEEPGGPRS